MNEVIVLPILDLELNNHLEDLGEERNGVVLLMLPFKSKINLNRSFHPLTPQLFLFDSVWAVPLRLYSLPCLLFAFGPDYWRLSV